MSTNYVAFFTDLAHRMNYPQFETTAKAIANAKLGRDLCGREPWEHYGHFKKLRAERQEFLAPDERWLNPDDILQPGDRYFANPPDWWDFNGKHSSITHGQPVPLDCYCYTPKGKRKRLNK